MLELLPDSFGLLPDCLELILYVAWIHYLWLPADNTGLPCFELVCLELRWHGVFWPFSCAGCFVVWNW